MPRYLWYWCIATQAAHPRFYMLCELCRIKWAELIAVIVSQGSQLQQSDLAAFWGLLRNYHLRFNVKQPVVELWQTAWIELVFMWLNIKKYFELWPLKVLISLQCNVLLIDLENKTDVDCSNMILKKIGSILVSQRCSWCQTLTLLDTLFCQIQNSIFSGHKWDLWVRSRLSSSLSLRNF